MNKVQLHWNKLQVAAEKQAAELHKQTGFTYHCTKQINGVHIEGYSQITNKWYTIKVVSKL